MWHRVVRRPCVALTCGSLKLLENVHGAFKVSQQAEEQQRRTPGPERNRTLISIVYYYFQLQWKGLFFFIPLNQMTMNADMRQCFQRSAERVNTPFKHLPCLTNDRHLWRAIKKKNPKTQFKLTNKKLSVPPPGKVSSLLLIAFVQLPTKMFSFRLIVVFLDAVYFVSQHDVASRGTLKDFSHNALTRSVILSMTFCGHSQTLSFQQLQQWQISLCTWQHLRLFNFPGILYNGSVWQHILDC